MKGYKGFDKDMKCRGMQFEVGKTYEHEGDVELCKRGFHFCENPLDIFNYYPPADSKFAEIEAEGVSPETELDSKRVSKKLTVKGFISTQAMVKLSVDFIFSKVDWKNNKESNTGDYSAATNTGIRSAASVEGVESVAISIGIEGKAKASLGSFIVLAEWKDGHRISVKSALVDGKKIKADTFYTLKRGKWARAD